MAIHHSPAVPEGIHLESASHADVDELLAHLVDEHGANHELLAGRSRNDLANVHRGRHWAATARSVLAAALAEHEAS